MLDSLVVPDQIFDTVARGYGGARAGRWLASAERVKQQLLLRGVVVYAEAAAHPATAEVRRAFRVMARVQGQKETRAAAEEVIRHPAVAAWATEAIRGLVGLRRTECAPERLAAVAAAVAMRARVRFTGVTVADEGRVVIPSLGVAFFPAVPSGTNAEIVVTSAGTTIIAGGTTLRLPADPFTIVDGWAPMRRIELTSGDLRLRLAIDDFDPYRFGIFPDLAAPLTDAEATEWTARFSEAWRLLAQRHRRFAAELQTMVSAVTPLRSEATAEVNATSRDVFGSIGLSRPRTALSLALALIHETQHAKLAALLDLAELVRPGTKSLYNAAWRSDPRPPVALLHGAYAFLGVAGFWRCHREFEHGGSALRAHAEYARWRDGTADAVEALAGSRDMTALGQRFLTGMRDTLDGWFRENGVQTLGGSKSASSR